MPSYSENFNLVTKKDRSILKKKWKKKEEKRREKQENICVACDLFCNHHIKPNLFYV
jgi:hypothetical protein